MFRRGHSNSRATGRRLKFESLEERVVLSIDSPVIEVDFSTPAAVSEPEPVPAAALTIAEWVQSLHYTQFNQLLPEHAPYLLPQQVGTIPDIFSFSQLSAPVRALLSAAQVQSLRVRDVHLNLLSAQQRGWLTIAQIQSLQVHDFQYLNAAQTPSLTPAQIASIPDAHAFALWAPAARAALGVSQVQALRLRDVHLHLLMPTQVTWLSEPQLQSLHYRDFRFLNAAQAPYLTAAQMASIPDAFAYSQLSPAARAALWPGHIRAMHFDLGRLEYLTPLQATWLTESQIQSLRYYDFRFLNADQTPALTPAQIASIPDAWSFSLWSPESRAALTAAQVQALNIVNVRLHLLTAQQVSWLSIAQIQSLDIYDFRFLSAAQTPWMTAAQIASIPDRTSFSAWTAPARTALTPVQVQSLRVRDVHLDLLTDAQRAWLSVSQVQSLMLWDFQYLPPIQVPHLTHAQVASVPDPGPFSQWSAASRAALNAAQIQSLRVHDVGLSLLTPQQVGGLSLTQVQSLGLFDFKHLLPNQIPFLTHAQIASIPDPGPFSEWSSAARAALTESQVQSLRVGDVHLGQLTPQQVHWLAPAQIQTLQWIDVSYLYPYQIPSLPVALFATIPDVYPLGLLTDAARAQFTRAQLLALPPGIWAIYSTSFEAPTNYVPTVDMPIGPDGMPFSHHHHEEADRVFNLVPLASATHVTVASGSWSNPATWRNGVIPSAGARVVISQGTAVRFESVMSAATAIKTLRIDGTLTFNASVNTHLYVDTIVVTTAGALHIGTPAASVLNNVTARVTITGGGPIDAAWDPYLLSRGLISRGEVRMHGTSVTPYAQLTVAPVRGSAILQFAVAPVNWKVGDKIVLIGTNAYVPDFQSEELTIRRVDGNLVLVDPLRFNHVPPAGYGLSVYAANTTRNIVFAAAEEAIPSQRPHMMFFHNPDVQIDNISVVGFGRTDKSLPINDAVVVNGVLQAGTGTNQRARYAMHFHHTGVNPAVAPATVRGSIIVGSPGWGYVNHSSNVVMENNVAYQVYGSSFVSEDGNEIGVMRGNLALNTIGSKGHLQSREFNHDFGHSGHGYWLQGPGVAVVDNISAGSSSTAFVYFTATTKTLFDAVNLDDPSLSAGRKAIPVGAAPLKEFSGNIAAASRSGLELWFHMTFMPTGESYIDDFTSWGTTFNGIDLHYSGQITIRNATLLGELYAFRGTGIDSNHVVHDITYDNVRAEGFEIGIVAPPRRRNAIIGGVLNAVQGIHIDAPRDAIRSLDIIEPIIFRTASAAQLGGREQVRVYMTAEIDFANRSLAAMLSADRIRMVSPTGKAVVLYFPEQSPAYVPFSRAAAQGLVPNEYLDLTNAELRRFGVSLGGQFPAADSIVVQGYRALLDLTP